MASTMSALAKTRLDVQEEAKWAQQEATLRKEEDAMKLKEMQAEQYEHEETKALHDVTKGLFRQGELEAAYGVKTDDKANTVMKAKMARLMGTTDKMTDKI